MVMKSGTNAFHGSGWYFLQRPGIDARDFFNPKYLIDGTFEPKPDSHRDQGDFLLAARSKRIAPSFLSTSRRSGVPARRVAS